jgi:predicted dehydrogenase
LDDALAERPDLVIVANPTSLHVETARKAIQAGAHVLVEKPLSHSLQGVQELLAMAEERGQKLMVGYQLRFHPLLARARELLGQGAIGPVYSARAEVGEYLPDWHPWEDYRQSYSGSRVLGGGPILTFSHEIDALCWLIGTPSRLSAMSARASALEIDTEDVAELSLQYDRGLLATVHMDYLRRLPKRGIELIGRDGILRWEYDDNRLARWTPTTTSWLIEQGDPRFDRNHMFLAELAHVAACLRGEIERPLIDGEQGAAVLALALASLQSARDGRVIDLNCEGEPVRTWLSSLEPR